jgi:hypothetical protein
MERAAPGQQREHEEVKRTLQGVLSGHTQ